jgi:hypothetical protein
MDAPAWYLLARREGSERRVPLAGPCASREMVDNLVPRADAVLMRENVREAFYRGLVYETALLCGPHAPAPFNAAFGVR